MKLFFPIRRAGRVFLVDYVLPDSRFRQKKWIPLGRTASDYPGLVSGILRRATNPYTEHSFRKGSGTRRPITEPDKHLKRIQRDILESLTSRYSDQIHPKAFAYARNKSAVQAARAHVGMEWGVKLDVSSFFHNIGEDQIFQTLRRIGLGRSQANRIAKLTTFIPPKSTPELQNRFRKKQKHRRLWGKERRIGCLPQGSPTSGLLANLVCYKLDVQFSALAAHFGMVYTRYSDDILLSSKSEFNRDLALDVLMNSKFLLQTAGFQTNDKKTRIITPNSRKRYLGISFNGDRISSSREFKRDVDSLLWRAKRFGIDQVCGTLECDRKTLYKRLKGKIEWVEQIEGGYINERGSTWADERKTKLIDLFGESCTCWACGFGEPVHGKILPGELSK